MKTIRKIADIYDGGNEIATTIDSTCTNDQVAGAKAVYDYIGQLNYIPNYMGIKSSSNIATTTTGNWTRYRLVLPTIDRSNGDKFGFDTVNGAVIVGAGVTKVRATLTATWQSSNANETSFGVYFYNHSTDTWTTLQPSFGENQSSWCTGATSVIIDVTEGDKIGVSFNTWVNGTITTNAISTGLLVEEYVGTTYEYQGTSTIATTINAGSTNGEVAGAKAVYDFGEELSEVEDITNQITYTVASGVTIDSFVAYKIGHIISLRTEFSYPLMNTRSKNHFNII